MFEILESSSCYLTTDQSEECTQADHAPHNPLPPLAFKNPSLKGMGEAGFLSMSSNSPEVLQQVLSFPSSQPSVGRLALLCFGQMDLSLIW